METDNNKPTATVVMLTWSPSAYRLDKMKESFASLKEHTHMPHTLVVVDNGPQEQTDYLSGQHIDIHIKNTVNKGVGHSRNQGLAATDTQYIAFVDNDITYFPDWLSKCIDALETYPDKKLIASGVKNKPMRLPKYQVGNLDGYELFSRCAGMCVVMKRDTINEFGGWSLKSNCGHVFSRSACLRKYRFIWHPSWNGRHTAKKSYHYKKQQFNPENGMWEAKVACV